MLWTVMLEKTLESPLDCKEIQPVHPKRDQSRVFIGRTDVEAETPILWPPHAESWVIWKDHDSGKDWGQEEKGWQRMRRWMASPTQWTWVWVNSGSITYSTQPTLSIYHRPRIVLSTQDSPINKADQKKGEFEVSKSDFRCKIANIFEVFCVPPE